MQKYSSNINIVQGLAIIGYNSYKKLKAYQLSNSYIDFIKVNSLILAESLDNKVSFKGPIPFNLKYLFKSQKPYLFLLLNYLKSTIIDKL